MDETNHRGRTIVMVATVPIDAVVGGLSATMGVGIGLTRFGSPRAPRSVTPTDTPIDGSDQPAAHSTTPPWRSRSPVDGLATHRRTRPSVRFSLWATAATLGLALAGPFAVASVAASVAMLRRARPVLESQKSRRRIERDIPDALDLFVLLLDAGLPARQCIDELARRGPQATRAGFAEVSDQLANGLPFAEAIAALRHRLGNSVVSLVDLIAASDRAGLPMSQVVHQMSAEARAARVRRDQAAARVLPIKLSFPLVLCTLPSFVLLAIAPAVMAALSSLGSNAW